MSVYKLVIVVRTDLRMPHGRIAAQVGHAAVNAYKRGSVENPLVTEGWLNEGGFKVVLKAKNEKILHQLGLKALRNGLPVTFVHDFNVKKREAVTATCIAIGPALSELLDKVTGKLRLL
jgi:PTH2 family peptidyl-tRNA hydrolase